MKPEPEIYLRTARALEVDPSRVLLRRRRRERRAWGRRPRRDDPGAVLAVRRTTPLARCAGWTGLRVSSIQEVLRAVLITTMNDIPGYAIDEVYGEVFGLTVRSRNIGSQFGAGLKSLLGGELKGMTKALVDSRAEVIAADGRRGGAEGRECDRGDAVRHVRDGPELDGDLRLRHGGPGPQAVAPARVGPLRLAASAAMSHTEPMSDRESSPAGGLGRDEGSSGSRSSTSRSARSSTRSPSPIRRSPSSSTRRA